MIFTTFINLKYKCIIEECDGCCDLFEEIELGKEEIAIVEKLGYREFWESRNGKYLLKKPCPFLKGKLCKIHLEHGPEKKFAVCRKYPFIITNLDNGDTVIDIKWSCPGVGNEKGEILTPHYLNKMLKTLNLKPKKAPVKKIVFLNRSKGIKIEWRTLARLYDFIQNELMSSKGDPYEKLAVLTFIIRYIASKAKKRIVDLDDLLREFLVSEGIKEEIALQIPFEPLAFSDILDSLKNTSQYLDAAAQRIGVEVPSLDPLSLLDKEFSKKSGELYGIYLSQSLKESLCMPWDLPTSYFWSAGIMCFIDILARGYAEKIAGPKEIRKAIRLVDFLNKSFPDFREKAYPIYPELGRLYVQFAFSLV